jgi:hypothetical protein
MFIKISGPDLIRDKLAEKIITCVKKNENGVIIQVGIDGSLLDVETVASHIWNNIHSYYTNAMGIRVKVHAFRDQKTNRPYLTTSANNKLPNNLKYLPICS